MSSGRAKMMRVLMQSRSKPKPATQPNQTPKRWTIVRGDTVQVISRRHPEHGKQGTVRTMIRAQNRVIVEGVNLGTRRIKGDPEKGTKGKTIMAERSMHYSNINLVDPVTGFPTKVTYSYLEDGTKVRISKRSGAIIPKPDILKQRRTPRTLIASADSDTMDDGDVWGITYDAEDGHANKWSRMRNELLRTVEERQRGGDVEDAKV